MATHYPVDITTACSIVFEKATRYPDNRRLRLQTLFLFKAELNGYITPLKHKLTAWLVRDEPGPAAVDKLRICYAKQRGGDTKFISHFLDDETACEILATVKERFKQVSGDKK